MSIVRYLIAKIEYLNDGIHFEVIFEAQLYRKYLSLT